MPAYPNKSSLAAYRSVAAHSGVAAADPHQLIMMLMDGALERISSARGAMEHGEAGARNHLIHRAVEIVQELRASLNLDAGGQIAANLANLYDYASRQLVRANLENRSDLLNEVGDLLRQIRGAWIQIPKLAGWQAMNGVACPTGRMLALGVVASTLQLVRAMEGGHAPVMRVLDLMQERRRLLGELARNVNTPGQVGSLAALQAAVAESDRTLGALIG